VFMRIFLRKLLSSPRRRLYAFFIVGTLILGVAAYSAVLLSAPTLQFGDVSLGRVSDGDFHAVGFRYLKERKLSIQYEARVKEYRASNLGVAFKAGSLQKMEKQCKDFVSSTKFWSVKKCRTSVPDITFDSTKLNTVLKRDFGLKNGQESRSAKVVYDTKTQRFVISDELAGINFNETDIQRVIAEDISAARTENSVIAISRLVKKVDPEVRSADLKDLLIKANTLVARKYIVLIEDKEVEITKDLVAAWFAFAFQDGAQKPYIIYDSNKVIEAIRSTASAYQKNPISQIINNGKVVQQGVDGVGLAGVEAAVDTIVNTIDEPVSVVSVKVAPVKIPFETSDTTPIPRAPVIRVRHTYAVYSKGAVRGNLDDFRKKVAETLGSTYGWRAAGVVFQEVNTNAQFDIVLTEASILGSYGGCSAQYSCRTGRLVMINDDRWQGAVPHWTLSLGDYRTMVINHEVGHWLGLGHQSCKNSGQQASVMQQQSISLQGCTANPWPTASDMTRLR
jgi:hypothetical protein